MNLRRRSCGSPLTWLAGFRWVEWNQTLQIVDTANPTVSTLNSITGNDLYGGQIGADLSLRAIRAAANRCGRGLSLRGQRHRQGWRVLQHGLSADDRSWITGLQLAVADQTAFFGEVGVNGSVRVTNWLSWRAGYSLFWLSGVAVPADQLALVSNTAPATINTNGSVLLHGVTTGLEARW